MSSTDTALRGNLGLAVGGAAEVSKWRFSGQLLLALIFLNSTLCFSAIWPTVYVLPDLGVSPEFVCLIMLLSAWVAVFGKPSARALSVISAVYLLMAFGHYADVVVPNLLGRPVNLYWDVPQLPRFVWVTVQGLPVWLTTSVALFACAAVWAYYRLLRIAMQTVSHAVQPVAKTLWLWSALLLAGVVVLVNYSEDPDKPTFVSKAVVPVYWKEAMKLRDILVPSRAAQLLPATMQRKLAWLRSKSTPVIRRVSVSTPLKRALLVRATKPLPVSICQLRVAVAAGPLIVKLVF